MNFNDRQLNKGFKGKNATLIIGQPLSGKSVTANALVKGHTQLRLTEKKEKKVEARRLLSEKGRDVFQINNDN